VRWLRQARSFDPDFAVFSTIDLGSLDPEETCPLCETNPPMLKYQIGSGRIRDEGCTCLSCACQLLNEITTLEIGHC
jgi:hypothetical protein